MADRLPPPILVEDERGFDELLDVLDEVDEVAVDTEADSFFNYREKVCLIQVTAGGDDWLVDPLAGFDLEPMGDALADPTLVKVFHDGEFDVLILKRDYGFELAGLFDTRVAAMALGWENPGLASVVAEVFDVELDKSQQRSDWSRRPLSQRQIEYARLDTHYLLPLREHLEGELAGTDLEAVVEGECRRVEALPPVERVFDPDEFVRVKGARQLDPAGQQALRELFVMRDGLARERDLPPFKVLGNAALIELARARPSGMKALERAGATSPRQARSLGRPILEALERARELGPLRELPKLAPKGGTGELSEEQVELHERLKEWRKRKAAAEGFDSSLVLNRVTLIELAKSAPGDEERLERVPGIQDWQVERYGRELVDVVRRFRKDLDAGRVPVGKRWRRR